MPDKKQLAQAILSGKIKDEQSLAFWLLDEEIKKLKEQISGITSGKDGHTPTESELLAIISPLVERIKAKPGKDGADGKSPTEAELLALIKPLIPAPAPTIQQITEHIPLEAQRVRDALETLTGEERLDKSAINGLDDLIDGKIKKIGGGSTARNFYQLLDTGSYVGQGGKVVKVKSDETGLEYGVATSSDEKVKYDAGDPTAGYLADKIIAGTGITIAEGTGADENKLKITNTLDLSGYVPTARTITINGTTYDLSANRSWTVSGISGLTATRVPFALNATTLEDNANFYFDKVNAKLFVTTEVSTGTLTAQTKLSLRAPTTSYYSNFSAPSSQTTTLAYVLPDAFPTGVSKHLTCDLSGNLTWDGVTASKTLLPIADGTYNLGSQDYRFSALYLSSIATDYIPVQGSGAYANLMGARSSFTCKNSRLGVIDNSNSFSLTYARTRLDIFEADQQVVSIDEGNFAQYATATLEGYSTDRARTLLLNRFGFHNQGGSSSHELVWGEYYLSGEEPYIEHHYRSGWTFGNDYGMGLTPDYPDTWLTHSHNMYLWDAVYGYTRELFDHKTYIRRSYNSVDSTIHRQHYESIDDNNLSIGDNALMNAPASGLASIVALGYNAGKNLTNSYGDVIIGTYAQSNSANGGYNVSIGHYAGYQIDGTYNISLGPYSASGTYAYTTQGIYIGAGSAHALTSGRTIIDNYDRGSTNNTLERAIIIGQASNASYATAQWLRFNVSQMEVLANAYFYFGYNNVDGSWRLGRSGNNLVIERRESGSWVTKSTISA